MLARIIIVMGSDGFSTFFFQAEDGIRDDKVTGVQTCALPICSAPPHGPVVRRLERPFLNFVPVTTIREGLARPHTASHTPPQASSTKNPSPSRSTGCASRSAHPCNDAGPAESQTRAPRRYTP